jgi:hypothetical protein
VLSHPVCGTLWHYSQLDEQVFQSCREEISEFILMDFHLWPKYIKICISRRSMSSDEIKSKNIE